MPFGLPARDEANWDTKLNDSINAVKATADAALPAAQKNAASGVAPLDAGSLVPQANLPAHLAPAALSATFARKVTIMPGAAGVVGDGTTDDKAAIQALIDSSATDLELVFPDDSTFGLSGPLTKTSGSIHIAAPKGATLKALASFPAGTSSFTGSMLALSGLTRTVVEGLTFDGNSDLLNGGAGFSDWTNYIHAVAVEDPAGPVDIHRNKVTNFPSIAISVRGGYDVRVADNDISDGMFHGIYVGFTTATPLGSRAWVTGNRVEGRGDLGTNTAIGGIGILVERVSKVVIRDNDIRNMSDTGTKTAGCDDVQYLGNRVEDSGKDGIKVQAYTGYSTQVSRAVVANNIVRRVNAWRTDGSATILLNDVRKGVVEGNLTEGGGTRSEDAIRVTSSTGSDVQDILVTGNVGTLTGAYGVYVATTGTATPMRRVSVIGNRLAGRVVVGSNVQDSIQVLANAIHREGTLSADVGVSLTGVGDGASADVADNSIADFGVAVQVVPLAGVNMRAVRVRNNTIRDCQGITIRIDNFVATPTTADLVEVSGNAIINPTRSGTSVAAVVRIGLANLTIQAVVLTRNIIRQTGAGTLTNTMETTGGTAGTSIGYADISGNILSGSTGTTLFSGYDRAARLKGLKLGAAPTFGTWQVGDVVEHLTPAASGNIGWVCTTAGSPGTWKTYGAISA